MNSTLPPARDLPPHRHARIRATLVRAASEPGPSRWMAPVLGVTTVIVALGLVMWFVPLGGGDTRPAGPATTDADLPSAAATPPAAESIESAPRQVRVPPDDVPGLVDGCVAGAGADSAFELKFAVADAAGRLAVFDAGDKMIACAFGGPTGGHGPTFTGLGGFRPPISVDLNQVAVVDGSRQQRGYQLVIGRVDPATTTRVTLVQADVTIDAVLVDGVYAARIVRPFDWWLTGFPNDDRPQPVVNAYNADGDLVGSASPSH
jgi:hypothetical protein